MHPKSYGDYFFEGCETLRTSHYSHYLIDNEAILKLNSMESIAIGLLEINDMLDELHYGIFYPLYKLYKELRYRYRKFKRSLKYNKLKSVHI